MGKRERIKDKGREVKDRVKRAFSDEEWAEVERDHEHGKAIIGTMAVIAAAGALAISSLSEVDFGNAFENAVAGLDEKFEQTMDEIEEEFSPPPYEYRPDHSAP